jgi:SnoaL-like domain
MSITTKEVADGLVALCREGKFMDAIVAYYGNDIVSVEPMAMGEHMPREVSGLEAVKAKGEWWVANHEVHSIEASAPAMSGDEFIVKFTMDVTSKQSGQRMAMEEFGVYWVKDGKIVREQFFFAD